MQNFIQQVMNGLVLGSVYALIALGLTMIYGVLGLINWAHGEFYMVGAFVGYILAVRMGLPYFVALVGAMLIMAVFGIVVERVVFLPLRGRPNMNVIIGTLGLSVFLLDGANLTMGPDPVRFPSIYTDQFIRVLGISFTVQRLLVVIVTLVLIAVLRLFIRNHKLGKAMRACSQDLQAASLMGIEINHVAMITAAIAASLAAAAGTLIGPIFLVNPQMSIAAVGKAFAVTILGGLGNVEGAVVAGFTLGLAESLTVAYISSYLKEIVAFAILITTLVFKPEGIFGKHSVEKV